MYEILLPYLLEGPVLMSKAYIKRISHFIYLLQCLTLTSMEDSENVSDYDYRSVINYFSQLFLSEVHYEDRTHSSQIHINNPEHYTLPCTLWLAFLRCLPAHVRKWLSWNTQNNSSSNVFCCFIYPYNELTNRLNTERESFCAGVVGCRLNTL